MKEIANRMLICQEVQGEDFQHVITLGISLSYVISIVIMNDYELIIKLDIIVLLICVFLV